MGRGRGEVTRASMHPSSPSALGSSGGARILDFHLTLRVLVVLNTDMDDEFEVSDSKLRRGPIESCRASGAAFTMPTMLSRSTSRSSNPSLLMVKQMQTCRHQLRAQRMPKRVQARARQSWSTPPTM